MPIFILHIFCHIFVFFCFKAIADWINVPAGIIVVFWWFASLLCSEFRSYITSSWIFSLNYFQSISKSYNLFLFQSKWFFSTFPRSSVFLNFFHLDTSLNFWIRNSINFSSVFPIAQKYEPLGLHDHLELKSLRRWG